MNGVLVQDSALGPRTTWANEMNFVMNHALGAGSIARPGDQQSMQHATIVSRIPPVTIKITTYIYWNRMRADSKIIVYS